eukprot:1207373-Pyramimonas_sp.AAC.1
MSKEEPVFRFYFANITSYGDKAKDQIRTWSKGTWLEESGPHLVGFVEHRMMGPKLTEAKKGLRRQGWRGDFVRAQPAINGGRQGHGGVAAFSRSHLHTTVPTTEEKLLFPDAQPPLPSQWAVQWVRFRS